MSSVDELHQDARPTAESWPSAEELLDGRVPLSRLWPSGDDLLDGKAAVPDIKAIDSGKGGGSYSIDTDSPSFQAVTGFSPDPDQAWIAPRFRLPRKDVPVAARSSGGPVIPAINTAPLGSPTLNDAVVDNGSGRLRSLASSFARSGVEAIASGLKGGARQIDEIVQERPKRRPLRVGSYPVLLSPMDWEPEPTEEELARKSRADLKLNPLYQAGEYLSMGAEEAYQPNPIYADSALTHAAEMAGGLLPMAIGGPLVAGAQTTEDVYRSAYDAFKKAGYTDEEAYQNADRIGRMAGMASGATFFVAPLASQYLSRPIAGRMANELAKRAVKRALDGATLGAVDRGIQDAIALNTYNPNLSAGDIAKDMGRRAVVMGALGMGTGAVSDAAKDGFGKIGKILIQPEARGVVLKPAPIGKVASTEPGGEGIQASFASEHPRVRLEIETPDGRIVFMDESGLDVSEESVRNKVEREYPGAAILKIESGQARDQEKLPSQLNQEPLMAAIGQFNASVGSDSNNGSKSVSNSEDLQTGAALSGKGPGTVSSGSSERNPPKREQISGVGNRQDASSGDDNDTRKSGLFSEWVQPTQPLYQDTVLPKSFELSAGQQKIWVHGNATEHLAEYAWGMLRRGVSPDLVNMATSIQLQSLRSAVEAVTTTGVPYNRMLYSGGWELKFGPAKRSGQMPVLYHARLVE